MTRANFLKLTAILFFLPFVNTYFNNSLSTSPLKEISTESVFNNLVSETHSHRSCFIPHPDAETQIFETPDFGFEMGKYIKDNFGNGENYRIKTVVIDAGHGGRDSGTSGKYLIEKKVALQIATKLGTELQNRYPEIQIIYTRTDDRFVPLNDRAKLANDNKADLFISIHCNSLPNSPVNNRVRGTETYVMGLHTAEQNLNVAKRENASILYENNYQQQYDGYDPNSPEGHIILSMFQNAYLSQSILLADQIESISAAYAGRKSHGVKQAGFVVLKLTTMPSVLIETGYLSNTEDEDFLGSEEGQAQMTSSILEAFTNYKLAIEDNNTSAIIANNKTTNKPVLENSTVVKVNQPITTSHNKSNPSPEPVQPVSRGMAPTHVVNDIDTAPSSNRKEESAIEYKVQLKTSEKLVDTSKSPWKNVAYSVQIIKTDNTYKYLVTGFSDKVAAAKVKEEMRQLGFKDAFVVAYKNGVRVD
jgi:N-acetylmuramoyl-L-alanine amidase